MSKLKEIKENLLYGAEFEGEEYDYKSLSQEDIYWLIKEVEKSEFQKPYKQEGMALFIKGKMVIGIHPDNLLNNLNAFDEGNLLIDWKRVSKNAGLDIGERPYHNVLSGDININNNVF